MLISTDSYGTESLQHPIRPAHLNVNASLFRFWGKTRPCEPVHAPKWHPLVFHSLDMAAVGEALLGRDRGPGCGLADLLGLQQDAATRFLALIRRSVKRGRAGGQRRQLGALHPEHGR